ncbi:MAG: CDP-alcohol phosphatidyltransferase [Candidatus Zixiibacteriota bacterium]|nr:MAG: CDP-alcohol phosphatidyltransferase [candidate division Zixibacteria bacterium]
MARNFAYIIIPASPGPEADSLAAWRAWLLRWSAVHATLLLAAAGLGLGLGRPWLIVPAAGLSFAALILAGRGRWTPRGTFGRANSVTALRLTGILALGLAAPLLPGTAVAAAGLILTALDLLDGWLARLRGEAGEFGAFFDKEADAFFVLLLCAALYAQERLGAWILVPGLLRYLFTLALHLLPARSGQERRSRRGRWVFALLVAALLICFLPCPAVYRPLAVTATVTLMTSFAADLRWAFSDA